MARSQPKLPGVGGGRRKIGRVRRALDAYVAGLRQRGDLDPFRESLVPALRDLADRMDDVRDDPDASVHSVAVLGRTYLDQLWLFRPVSHDTDPLDELTGELDAALRDSTAT